MPRHEIWALQRRRDVERFQADLRAAHTAAILASVYRKEGTPPLSPLEFVTVPCGAEEAGTMSDVQMYNVARAMVGLGPVTEKELQKPAN